MATFKNIPRSCQSLPLSAQSDREPFVVQASACSEASRQPKGWITYPSAKGLAQSKPWRAFVALVLLLSLGGMQAASSAADQNWPQWRGPLGTGIAPTANPPVVWSETNNLKWKVKIPGQGSATPIVWEQKIFIQTAVPTGKKGEPSLEKSDSPAPAPEAPAASSERPRRGGMGGPKPTEVYQFVVLCLDRQTGKVLWHQVAREVVPHEGFKPNDGSFASSSPVTDGQHVFAYFGSRGLHCYDLDGQLKWSQDLGRMRIVMSFGEGSSPALAGDTLIVNWDNEEGSFIVAVDKNTGKTLWKIPRDERTSWATPLVVEVNGQPQVVTAASGKIRSYDPATGKVIWECGGLTRNVIPTPVVGNGLIFCTSGYQGNALLAIRLDRTGDLTGTDAIVWSHNKGTPYVPSPLLYEGKLYFLSNNKGQLSCLDATTGKPFYAEERLADIPDVYASLVGAAGRIYLTGRNGVTVVIKPSDKLELLATNRLDEKIDASPVAVGRELFLRGREYLYCLTEK
jgi:outer membrane protein assembly factor BamB